MKNLSLTIVIPRVVIPKSDTNCTKQNIFVMFLILILQTKDRRQEGLTHCALMHHSGKWRTAFQRRVAFLRQQLQWHVKNREDTWLPVQMWPHAPSLIWVRRINNAPVKCSRWPRIESSWIQTRPALVGCSGMQLSPRERATHLGHNFSTAIRRMRQGQAAPQGPHFFWRTFLPALF